MDPIVIATGNPHKVQELRAIFAQRGLPVVGLADLPGHESFREPDETGRTFEENAAIKALSYAEQTGRTCLADDSGLEVDALHGAPGVISSHYSTNGQETGLTRPERDAANNERLLRELEGLPLDQRTARFICVMVLARPPFQPTNPSGTGVPPVSTSSPSSFSSGPVSPLSFPHSPSPPLLLPPTLEISRRNLPHWEQAGSTYFVTFRVSRGILTPEERQVVLDACLHWHRARAMVSVVTVMPDHAHLVLRPLRRPGGEHYTLSELLHSIKGFTSHRILKSRGEPGPLWQDESFDRILRNQFEFDQKCEYVWLNPVKEGLVKDPGSYPFTSAPGYTEALVDRVERRWILSRERGGEEHRRDACATGVGREGRPLVMAVTRGAFEGRIGLPGEVPRGDNGFGYDPLFLVAPDYTRTSAELSPAEKNNLSHRGAAARAMADRIAQMTEPRG